MHCFFSDLFGSIKKTPVLFLFMFIQIVITSFVVYSMLSTYYWTEEQNNSARITWGDNEFLKLGVTLNLTGDRLGFIFHPYLYLHTTYSDGNGGLSEEEYEFRIDLLRRIDTFYKKACQIEGLAMVVTQGDRPLIISPDLKEWDESDMRGGGDYDFFYSDLFNSLHLLYIDTDYRDFFKFNLSEGAYFEEIDYLYEKDYVPVLMGADFRKYFSLGEVFEARDYPLEKKQYKVIGFISENQYFSCANMPNRIYRYDNFIIVPYIEKDLLEMIDENSEYYRFLDLFTSRFVQYSFFIIKSESYETVREELENLLDGTGLDIYFTFYRHRAEKELASNFKDQLVISIVVCITTLLFSLFSLVFTMLYKIDGNMKNYAIRMVTGETHGGIAFRYLFESFTVFLLGQITGFSVFKIYALNSYIYQGYDYLEAPTLRTGIILNIAFYILTAIVLYICVNVKLKTYSLATLIRSNEVKKEKRMPFYRIVIFFMLAIVGVFSMFIASYRVALDRIDIYYMGYYTKNAYMATVHPIVGVGAPEAEVDIDVIGAEANDAIINKYLYVGYKGEDYISERGIFFNGYIEPVNLLEGRFFTKEETAGKDEIAVVGKEIYEKYVTFNDYGEPIYYCNDLDKELKVIGVIGKEDQTTNMDLTVFMPIKLIISKFGSAGSYTLDGKNKETVAKLEDVFISKVSPTADVQTRKYTPRLTVEAPTDMLLMLLIIITINAIVFCFYYVSKQGHIHGVKKIIGYSKIMILTDTFFDFILLTLGAFVTGNALVILLKETVFKNVQLFSIYMLDPQVIVISLAAVILLTVFLSVIAIAKTFTAGNTNEYRA